MPPTPAQIKRARAAAGLTQGAAAELVYKNIRTWQAWEGGENPMEPAFFELFLLKTKNMT